MMVSCQRRSQYHEATTAQGRSFRLALMVLDFRRVINLTRT